MMKGCILNAFKLCSAPTETQIQVILKSKPNSVIPLACRKSSLRFFFEAQSSDVDLHNDVCQKYHIKTVQLNLK